MSPCTPQEIGPMGPFQPENRFTLHFIVSVCSRSVNAFAISLDRNAGKPAPRPSGWGPFPFLFTTLR